MAPLTLEIETILLCDDEHSVCHFVRTLLTQHGYRVLEADNGRHALEVAEAHGGTIQLLLTDVMMPELNGPDLAEQLRAVRPDVLVIFMSAAFTDGLLASLDGCPLLQKPFDRTTLLEVVGDSLAEPPKPLRGNLQDWSGTAVNLCPRSATIVIAQTLNVGELSQENLILRAETERARLDLIRTDLGVCMAFAAVAETAISMGHRKHAERTIASAEKGYSDMMRYFFQAKGMTAEVESELHSKFRQLRERLDGLKRLG